MNDDGDGRTTRHEAAGVLRAAWEGGAGCARVGGLPSRRGVGGATRVARGITVGTVIITEEGCLFRWIEVFKYFEHLDDLR